MNKTSNCDTCHMSIIVCVVFDEKVTSYYHKKDIYAYKMHCLYLLITRKKEQGKCQSVNTHCS